MSSNVQIDTSASAAAGPQQNGSQQQNSSESNTSNGSQGSVNNRSNLIVNYLPQSVKEHDFNLLFSKIGPLKSCKLMFDRTTGYSFGYGFVEYVNEEDAKKAIETLNGYQIEHKRLKVALARPNCEETKNTNLYIRNIPITYDEQQLHDLFAQYGDVVQVRLLRDQNTTFSRRIGFVIMATKQMAQIAIQNLDNTLPPNGGNEPIYVKYADEDGTKKKQPPGMMNHHQHHHQNHHHHHHHHQNNRHHNNHHHHHQNHQVMAHFQNHNQNSYHQNSQYQQANSHFNHQNAMMMQQAQANAAQTAQQSAQNQLNLGKMKTNRSSGHQNRYNPIGGQAAGAAATATGANPTNGALNTLNNGAAPNGNNYNPWNLGMASALQQQQQQQGYSNFGNLGNTGFDNLINTIGQQQATGPGPMHHQMQAHAGSNSNYLNAAAAMAAAAAAAAAAAGLGNSSSNGNLLDVSMQDTSKPQAAAMMSNTIYVYGIGSHASESDLYSLFSNCGRIARVNVIKNPKTGQSKGFGFVVFETFEEANLAVHTMNGYVYHNRPLQVQLHLDS